jgi:hypothetical protein
MKRNIFYLCAILVLNAACTNKEKNLETTTPPVVEEKLTESMNMIDSATAVQWTQNWREFMEHNTDQGLKNAFLIHDDEISTILNVQPAINKKMHMRVYMGLDSVQTQHVILVAVDSNGNDLFNYAAGQYAYDFDHPCPTVCGDEKSPLYKNAISSR